MGRDRQEAKLRKARRVESDRDQSIENKRATTLEGPDKARERNRP